MIDDIPNGEFVESSEWESEEEKSDCYRDATRDEK